MRPYTEVIYDPGALNPPKSALIAAVPSASAMLAERQHAKGVVLFEVRQPPNDLPLT
jgi:hypothetical protein